MRFLIFALAALAVVLVGCSSNFRAGGPQRGVEAGAAVGPLITTPAPASAPQVYSTPEPPLTR